MRVVILLSLLLVSITLAKPVEEKSKPIKSDGLQAISVSPSTNAPLLIPTEVVPHENHPDGEPTFEEEITRVIEGSVESLIPFGVPKSSVVKKESANEEAPPQTNESTLSVVDWFDLMFSNSTTSADQTPVTTTETSMEDTQLDWLQMILNHQKMMNQMPPQQPQTEVVMNPRPETPDSFASKYQQWQEARQLSAQWYNLEPQQQKQDQYSAAQKSKLNWSKLMAEPVEENYKQYIPSDNTVQWSSNEMPSTEMVDNSQKQLMIPSTFMKNKEQWFGESEM